MGNVQQQKEEKKLHLMQAAETMFLQKGFAGTSIDDIVRTAGVAKGTFYLYFQDKAEIWDAVVVQISLRVLAQSKLTMESSGLADTVERILFVADDIIEYFRCHTEVLRMIRRDFSWPLVLKKMEEAQDSTLMQMLDQCFCSPCLSRYSLEEAYRLMFMIIEMVGSISYTSIILEQPAPIDQMKPLLFRAIRRILA